MEPDKTEMIQINKNKNEYIINCRIEENFIILLIQERLFLICASYEIS